MQDGNHVIARVADSHMPKCIMESEVRRFFSHLQGLSQTDWRTDCDDAVGPRTDVDPCTQNIDL